MKSSGTSMLGRERRAASSACSRVWACRVIQRRSVLGIVGVLFVEVGVVGRGGPVAEAPPLTTRAPVMGVFHGRCGPRGGGGSSGRFGVAGRSRAWVRGACRK